MSKIIEKENIFLASNYSPFPIVITKGKNSRVWDENGKEYIDMMSAYSAVSHGHCHPRLIKKLHEQAGNINVISRAYHSDQLAKLAEKLCVMSGFDKMLPMNTGAEAVETAIKAARRYGYLKKHIAEDHNAEIIVAKGNFHGRTTTIVGFSSEADYRKGFGPFPQGFVHVPFGNAEALEKAITPNCCAVLIEPIQGEGGIIVPPKGYLAKVQTICKKHDILLIVDEVQSGLGRTGKLFAFQHEIDLPDAIILGKALGGGILPISAFLATDKVMSVFNPGSHGSTFGGNPLAAAIAHEALLIIEEEHLVEKSHKLGAHMMQRLKKINSKYVKDVRGKGLWIGLELDTSKISAYNFCLKLIQNGVLSKDTHNTVIRLAPPLTIEADLLDKAIDIIEESLSTI